ncbi:CpXC domain-containing protein [Acetobacterium woodii]|uniref:CpXC domain-containing protein n=1 Tax=Acetobacterium woodii (strain ATCC 29683 / DSM 1030 / JCM 2381 / KCTC 1655 / WB1) TaxID=931626 RepID=H6LIR0_ACEWD|nr:CpXC domain-containing protein [Acetobacterium woodii]AFA49799.1 hypothetical protein Awo_c30710 [Acetobacterium woodii DSM 1030]
MATKKTIMRTCPECGAYFNVEAYEMVNATLDQAIREEVIFGRIFDFTCPVCGHRFRSPYSTAYKEMEKEYIIFLDLDDATDNCDEMISEEELIENQIKETQALFPTYRIRVVHDMMDLIEKIHIFSAGLNDKIITYLGYKIKDDVTLKMKTAKPPIQVNKALFDSLRGKEGQINFGLLSTSPKPIFVTTPTRDYEYLLKKSPLRHQFEEAEGLYQIDEGWAAGIDKVLIA